MERVRIATHPEAHEVKYSNHISMTWSSIAVTRSHASYES